MKNQNKQATLTPAGKAAGQPAKVTIRKLPTGVRGLDDILGGGIPEFSFKPRWPTRSFSPTPRSGNPRSTSPSSGNPR